MGNTVPVEILRLSTGCFECVVISANDFTIVARQIGGNRKVRIPAERVLDRYSAGYRVPA